MKTAQHSEEYTPGSRKLNAPLSLNAAEGTRHIQFRDPHRLGPPVISHAMQNFDLVALLHEVSEAGRSIAGDKPVTVMDASCAGPVMVYSDRPRIKQIMMGLMSNAAEYTERGRIALILSKDDDKIRVTVADTGKGMAREKIDAVRASADDWRRGDMTGSPPSGLGLRIVQALIKQLHRGFSIVSKPGEGTIVEVSLPINKLR